MKYVLILTLTGIFMSIIIKAQETDLSLRLYNSYEHYKEKSLTKKRFRHGDLAPLISKLKRRKLYSVKKLGSSIENRDINLISAGSGKTKVLLWSQMHGDESTATMALFDVINFLDTSDGFDELRGRILQNLTLYFIPMLNPDGAERFQRRNALDIDLNRDAISLQCPESAILKDIRDSLNADFGFNLHDQSPRYSVGSDFRSAALSFLAPAFSYDKSVNDVREKAMKLIAQLYRRMSEFIPGHMAKYSDEFEPRAFGDNIQRWGTSTILIETGGWCNDYEKQFLRKLNFIALLTAFNSIAQGDYNNFSLDEYYNIPNNDKYIFDLILRNLTLTLQGKTYKIDLGINRYETNTTDSLYFKSIVEDMGDLSTFHGLEEYECYGMEVEPGKTDSQVFASLQELSGLNLEEFLNRGITSIQVLKSAIQEPYTKLPINVKAVEQNTGQVVELNEVRVNEPANLIIRDKGKVRFVIINGFLYDLRTSTSNVYNGLVVE